MAACKRDNIVLSKVELDFFNDFIKMEDKRRDEKVNYVELANLLKGGKESKAPIHSRVFFASQIARKCKELGIIPRHNENLINGVKTDDTIITRNAKSVYNSQPDGVAETPFAFKFPTYLGDLDTSQEKPIEIGSEIIEAVKEIQRCQPQLIQKIFSS